MKKILMICFVLSTISAFSQTPFDPPADGDPLPPTKVNLKLFIEGYYDVDNHTMKAVKSNQGIGSSTTYVDDITVELRNAASGSLVATTSAQLQTNGTAVATYSSSPSGNYYIAIKHRNGIETWTASTITVGTAPASYDFTTSASKVYGNNQVLLESGVYGIYSGDINQDGFIDSLDITPISNDSDNFEEGYLTTDVNGDGFADALDLPLVVNNADNFIEVLKPYL